VLAVRVAQAQAIGFVHGRAHIMVFRLRFEFPEPLLVPRVAVDAAARAIPTALV